MAIPNFDPAVHKPLKFFQGNQTNKEFTEFSDLYIRNRHATNDVVLENENGQQFVIGVDDFLALSQSGNKAYYYLKLATAENVDIVLTK